MATQWQWRNRGSRGGWESIADPEVWWAQMEYRQVQVVDAARRGDQCYVSRTGFFWHVLDRTDSSIDTSTVAGPFATRREAEEDTKNSISAQRFGRKLKSLDGLCIVSVAVVNETPGSRREIPVDQLGTEIRRMGGERLAQALDNAGLGVALEQGAG